MILILASPDDDHVAAVEPELRRRGASVLWLDLAELPARAQLSVAHEPGAPARPLLRVRDTEIDLRLVTAVWSCRPGAPTPHADLPTGMLRDYVRQETSDAWIGVTELLDCLWLPGPRWQELRAGYKSLQLQVATELGFEIPPTLVTNSPDDFLAFYRQHNGNVVSKTVHNKLLPAGAEAGYSSYVLTETVANRDVAYRDAIRYCPVTIQPYVDKRIELRITVVGDRVFPVEVHSQWTNHTRYDWRRADHHHTRYQIHQLPRPLARRCLKLVERLGLRFGAIDLILTPDGRYIFLEINPNGAWLWMERTTGLPIGKAVCDLLLSREATATQTRVPVEARPTANPATPPPPQSSVVAPPLSAARRSGPRIPATVDAALQATLRYLLRLAHGGISPAEAATGLQRLARRHRETDLRLVWEIEGYLGSVHYDALLRLPGAGTLSLAFSPERAVPWALRHAHHARETDLLRVNGQTLNMQTVMGYLDWLWQDAALVTGLVDGCLVREAVEIRGIGASDGEVRAAMLGFRREQGLDSGAATDGWLRRRGWTRDDLEHECRRQVIAGKLRAQIAAGRVRSYFARHRGQFDTAAIARLRLADRDAARRIARRIKPGGIEFTRTLEETILARPAGTATSTFETVRRRDLAAAHARAIFGAPLGGVIGPMRGADGYDVLRVLRIARARLDRPTRELIEQVLFEEWLATRRAEATVEWFWGDAERAVTRAGSARRPR